MNQNPTPRQACRCSHRRLEFHQGVDHQHEKEQSLADSFAHLAKSTLQHPSLNASIQAWSMNDGNGDTMFRENLPNQKRPCAISQGFHDQEAGAAHLQ